MKKLLTCIALGFATTSYAVTPLWMRDVQISPDGTEIAFCYKGDIYKVPAKGGTATQLTTQASYECTPIWSPDGKQIAFASDRNGNFDLFVMPSNGGTAQCLTTHSASEIPSAFTPDGKYVLFSASIQDPAQSALFPTSAMTELYKVPIGGGRTEQVLGTPAEMVCFDKSGKTFLYQDRKGFEDEWRKHHTSSVTRDIWMYDTQTGKHTNLTDHAGEDRNAVFTPDGQTVYFLSERNGGSFNVYSFPLNTPQSITAVTKFKTHPVRFLSTSSDNTLCYTYDGEIYTQRPGVNPQKVRIDLIRDDQEQISDLNSSKGATSATVSPDGKQIALTLRGEVFVTSADYNTTKQITNTPAAETGVCFSPDNRTLAYASERGGNWQLYLAKIARKEEANFPNATIIEEEVLLPSKTVERNYPQFSPDGKELAFIEDRMRLMVVNLETKKVRQVTDGSTWYSTAGGFDYSWSPDGKWFTLRFIGNKHDPYSDIGLVSAQGGEITNLTNSGYTSTSPQWVLDGNAILFTTERYGMRAHASWGSLNDAMLVFMNQDAYDKFRLSKEDYELQKELEKEQKEVAGDKQEQKRFYNVNMHGVNWEAMTAAYRKFLPHINNNYDFAELLSEYLGELNVSHTGGRFRPQTSGNVTANLGLLFDWNHSGKGLLIAEVVEKGPFDHARSKVKAGTVMEKIDGQEITPDMDYSKLLNNKTKKKTLVSLYDPQTKERWEEVVLPISNGELNNLLYTRWVKQRAADVDKWSNGRLGYVHIQSMGDPSFRSVYSDILGKYNDREGIVIDTRFNGGGRLHEDIEILFSGEKYLTQVTRGREACDMPSRRWNKPSIMLQCEANYSNAHGTPWVYKHQHIGRLVGMPVPGTMTTVSWETLQDPTLIFGTPITGYRLSDGSYLENTQLEPDVKVANSPETVVKGEDTQLRTAVNELLKEIDKK